MSARVMFNDGNEYLLLNLVLFWVDLNDFSPYEQNSFDRLIRNFYLPGNLNAMHEKTISIRY